MKRFFRDKRTLGILLVMFIAAATMQKLYTYICTIDRYVLSCDSCLPSETDDALQAFIKEHPDLVYSGALSMLDVLVKEFPAIKSLTMHHYAKNVVHMEIGGMEPLYMINNELVFTEQHTFVSKEFFADHSVASIPTIEAQLDDVFSDVFVSCLARLPSELARQFYIRWKNETEIVLSDKEQPNISLVCTHNRMPDEKLLLNIGELKNDLEARGAFTGPKQKHWIFDTRFDSQIVLFSQEGGYCYG